MTNTKQKIYKLLSEIFNEPLTEIKEDIGPGDLARWDSLGHIQLISTLEKEFETKFSIDQIMSINNVEDIINVVNELNTDSNQVPTKSTQSKPFSSLRTPNILHFGQNSTQSLRNVKATKIGIIFGANSEKHIETIKKALPNNADITLIKRPNGEPKEEEILKKSQELKEKDIDCLIALGGGSTIDFSKLCWALIENPSLTIEEIIKPFSITKRESAQFIAIPTLFGSGAEASSAATFTKAGQSNKSIALSHTFIPDQVILDSLLASDIPQELIISGIFDALTHAIEGYVSPIQNDLVKKYTFETIKVLVEELDNISNQKPTTLESLDNIAYASYWAGIIQNHCSTGLAHSIGHQLTGLNISHAKGVASFLVPVMKLNSQSSNAYDQLAENCDFDSTVKFIEKIQDLYNKLRPSFDEGTINKIKNNATNIINGAKNDPTFKTNPVLVSDEQIQSLINQI
jgi:alcohol dehydrogenase